MRQSKQSEDYLADLTEIRSIMERSAKFDHLSGWAGIAAGCYALIAAAIAHFFLGVNQWLWVHSVSWVNELPEGWESFALLAITLFIVALGTAVFLSNHKAAKSGQRLWNALSKRLLGSMLLPLGIGMLLISVFVTKGLVVFVLPLMLLFYGLALYNASNFTHNVIKVLALAEITLGIISLFFLAYSFYLWIIGFGVLHIIYGVYLLKKHEA